MVTVAEGVETSEQLEPGARRRLQAGVGISVQRAGAGVAADLRRAKARGVGLKV